MFGSTTGHMFNLLLTREREEEGVGGWVGMGGVWGREGGVGGGQLGEGGERVGESEGGERVRGGGGRVEWFCKGGPKKCSVGWEKD